MYTPMLACLYMQACTKTLINILCVHILPHACTQLAVMYEYKLFNLSACTKLQEKLTKYSVGFWKNVFQQLQQITLDSVQSVQEIISLWCFLSTFVSDCPDQRGQNKQKCVLCISHTHSKSHSEAH